MSKADGNLMPFTSYDQDNTNLKDNSFSITDVAEEQGLNNNPPSSDTEFDQGQTSIKNSYARDYTKEKNRFTKYLGETKAQLEPLKTKVLNLNIKISEDSFSVKLTSSRSKVTSILTRLSECKYNELRHLNFFKKKNKIQTIARYPESSIFHFSLLFVIIVVECIANSYFFARGNDLGLLGGFLQASLISLVNVGSASLLGVYCLRYLIHINIGLRVFNFLILFSYIAFIIVFNLGVGHYRDLRSLDPLTPVTASLQTMLNDPFNITFDGSMLFFIGIGVTILASFDSYKLDDPYPHYGKMDRAYKEATLKYEDKKEDCRQDLELLSQNALKEIEVELQQADLANDKFGKYLIHANNACSTFKNSIKTIDNRYLEGLKQYRQSNIAIRTDPPPKYFSIFQSEFSSNLGKHDWVDSFDAVQKELIKHVKTNQSQRDEVKKKIMKLLKEELTQIDTFIANIDKDMPDKLTKQDQLTLDKDK